MGYSTRDVVQLLDLPAGRIRSYARAGFLEAERAPDGRYRYSFQDLVILRTAAGLGRAHVPGRRIARALRSLKRQLPRGRSLAELRILADGDRVVVRDGGRSWDPLSGQFLLDFDTAELAARVASMPTHGRGPDIETRRLEAQAWFNRALDLEATAPGPACEAYRHSLELNPHHADAHTNLGRLLHHTGDPGAAALHYREALAIDPGHALAAFNLGIALEDLRQPTRAIAAYRRALALRPDLADAHFNLSRLLERNGDRLAALRHLRRYRQITGSRGAP